MNTRNTSIVAGFAAMALASIAWVPTQEEEKEKTLPAAEIASVIKDLKWEVTEDKDEEEKTFWTIDIPGEHDLTLYQYGGEGDVASSLGVSAGLEVKASLEQVNEWNMAARFVKAYAIDDETIVLEDDLDISIAPSKAVVKQFLKAFADAIPEFEKSLE